MNEHGKTPILVSSAPAPIGPYSQAIKCRDLVFVSGQLGLNLATGELVGPDVADQAQKALEHLQAILEAAGSAPVRVVKTTIFLTNLADFSAVNEVYGKFFPYEPPARSTIQVAALPKGAKVEIEAVATVKSEDSQFSGSRF
jgi:2-iminobutanoate/2-iminopropanoate deaminase